MHIIYTYRKIYSKYISSVLNTHFKIFKYCVCACGRCVRMRIGHVYLGVVGHLYLGVAAAAGIGAESWTGSFADFNRQTSDERVNLRREWQAKFRIIVASYSFTFAIIYCRAFWEEIRVARSERSSAEIQGSTRVIARTTTQGIMDTIRWSSTLNFGEQICLIIYCWLMTN